MFYIDHVNKDKKLIGVADSDDGAIDLITRSEFDNYLSKGIDIIDWGRASQIINASMVKNCNYHLWKKLQRDCTSDTLTEYLARYSVYDIANLLNKFGLCLDLDKECKVFDYSVTSNYIIFTVTLSDNSVLLARIDSSYGLVVDRLDNSWHYEKYPSCAGFLLAKLFKRYGIDTSGIIADEPYLLLYSTDNLELILINHFSMKEGVLKKKNKDGVVIK